MGYNEDSLNGSASNMRQRWSVRRLSEYEVPMEKDHRRLSGKIHLNSSKADHAVPSGEEQQKPPRRWLRGLAIGLAVVFLTGIWFAVIAQRVIPTGAVPEDGVLDLSRFDLNREVLSVAPNWDYYPEKLYTSEDFRNGTLEKSSNTDIPKNIPYGTYRLVLKGEASRYYMMCGYSIDYGTKILVNGSQVLELGTVADRAENAVGCANYMSFPLSTDANGQCELIFQFSNFVHDEGGEQYTLLLSTPENIRNYQAREELSVNLVSCGLMLLGAYYLVRAAFRMNRESFWLAVCCFLLSLRNIRFFLGEALPLNYDWQVYYRVVVILLIWIVAAILKLMDSLYPGLTRRGVQTAFAGCVLGSSILMFTVPTRDCVRVSYGSISYLALYLIYFIVVLVRHFIKIKKLQTTDKITLSGFGVLLLAQLAEVILVRRNASVTHGGFTSLAMIAFIMLMMAVLSLKEQETQLALAESRRKLESLEEVDHLKTEFFRNMAHEIRTPLTVTSGYAQRTKHRLQKGLVDEENIQNLDLIQSESERLAVMVNQMLHLSLGMEKQNVRSAVNVRQLMFDVSAVCRPLLLKNNNQLELVCEEDLVVDSNHDTLMQVLINLATNANRYTRDGRICFMVSREEPQMAAFRVSDTGCGIRQDIVDHIFEEGVTWNGDTGRGLAIAKEIIERNGGTIAVEKTGPEGTTMRFTVPLCHSRN